LGSSTVTARCLVDRDETLFDQWVSRKLGWIGLLFVAFILMAIFAFNTGTDYGWDVRGPQLIRYYDVHNAKGWASFYFFVGGLVVLLLVATTIADILRRVTQQRILPALVFAGAILFFAGSAYSGAAGLGLLEGARKGISPATAETLQALSNTIVPLAFQVGGFFIAVAAGLALILARKGWMWLGILSVVIGVLLVLGPIGLAPFALLVPLLGFVMARLYVDSIRVPVIEG
jgi:hypothetical protein